VKAKSLDEVVICGHKGRHSFSMEGDQLVVKSVMNEWYKTLFL
jgi:hypothetical protein